ncbi:hypothetical protein CYG48_20055 (plasmid) [Neorhizobium sp. SOG26]|uniref:DUF1488 domain-containing protein n=1 Tax=Neorhizobium turbinariae TaxID=2937795 RepID=A0ABT0INJ0_9HYPH|nr:MULTISPECIES: hypothetical protein [Neorhizobium]AXV18067.1 hypothetical protein CYG48_20055 [Neorhizobium sp. SOG26]MCK8779413.1 hypothetical protein [Neorhizobium turbinariae]
MTGVHGDLAARSRPWIDVQLHYDHFSGRALICFPSGERIMPSRYPSREAAADAARELVALTSAENGAQIEQDRIRIWLR